MKSREVNLSGWGRNRFVTTTLVTPSHEHEIHQLLTSNSDPLLAIGKLRSYGDACLIDHFITLQTNELDSVIQFDTASGVLVAEAGIILDGIIRIVIPHGWFIPVTPGTRFPTLSGCLASDVHGKNHHRAGSIGSYVQWFDLMIASGEVIRCSNRENAELFHATLGGMGLTGVILRIALQLEKVPSAHIHAEYIITNSLAETMETLISNEADWPFTVAWLDTTAGGSKLGRGEVSLGKFAEAEELTDLTKRYEYPKLQQKTVPEQPIPFVTPFTESLFNFAFYHKSFGKKKFQKLVPLGTYFYPLDAVGGWNRLYGKPGFLQYQFVVPAEASSLIETVLRRCRDSQHPSALTVLKRFGEGRGWLSFPKPGWTLALDFPIRAGLEELLLEFDAMVIEAGGRHYLAKDNRISRDIFLKGYSEYDRWLAVKRQYDPRCRFSSEMSRRLGIDGDVR